MVNRVWQYHFGQGMVATPSDFGFNGDRPSHPELLDWLAAEYIANGWRLKPIHRLIVLSATYRQSSRLDAAAQAVDAAEPPALADAAPAARGRGDPRRHPRVQRPARPARWAGRGTTSGSRTPTTSSSTSPAPSSAPTPSAGWSTSSSRGASRTRPSAPSTAPTAALVAPRRNASTTALQALNLLNSRFVLQQAAYFADGSAARPAPTRRAGRPRLRLAFGRAPTAAGADAAVGPDPLPRHGGLLPGPVQRQRIRVRAVIRTRKASEAGT